MWKKFRWDMFVTSFIPLWFSIFVLDIWNLIKQSIAIWNAKKTFCSNISFCFETSIVQVVSVAVMTVIVFVSITGVTTF